jgi:hypothetical protein
MNSYCPETYRKDRRDQGKHKPEEYDPFEKSHSHFLQYIIASAAKHLTSCRKEDCLVVSLLALINEKASFPGRFSGLQ